MVLHKCPDCAYNTTISTHFKRHRARHAPRGCLHVCGGCGKGFTEAERCARHAATHAVGKHGCPRCAYRTSRADTLRRHIARNHLPSRDASGRYVCKCGYLTTRKALFVRHIAGRCTHPCPECHASCATATELIYHRIDHVDAAAKSNYRCSTCAYTTTAADAMREHLMFCR